MTQLAAALRGELDGYMRADAAAVLRGTRQAVVAQTEETKRAARALVAAAFTGGGRGGSRVANAIRSRVYDNAPGDVAGLVYSKFGRREGGTFQDYLLPHIEGGQLRPRDAKFMAIPFNRRRRPMEQALAALDTDPKLALVPLPGGRFMLVRRTRTRTTLLGLLVRRVTMKRRLDPRRLREQAQRGLEAKVERALGDSSGAGGH